MQGLLDGVTWGAYPHVRKYLAVVHVDLSTTHTREIGKWLVIAPLIGTLTGAVIVLEVLLILQVIWVRVLPWYYAHHWLMIPGLLVGFGTAGSIMRYLTRDPDLHSTDEVVGSYHEHHGDIHLRSYWPKLLASVATIACGGSVGLEGPSIYAGAGVGSWLWTKLHRSNLSWADRKVMLISGAAAGLAAVFRAPLTGVIFALEMPFHDDLAHEALVPSLISSVVAYSVAVAALGSEPLFSFSRSLRFHNIDLAWAALLGLICGVVAMAFSIAFRKFRVFMIKLPLPHVAKLLVGGLGVALCGIGFASLFNGPLLPLGPNYQIARNLLAYHYPSEIVLLYASSKAVAAILTLGSGGVGAMFVPLLLLGESVGRVFGQSVVHAHTVDLYCAIGMAAFIAAGYKTPLAAVAFVAETTGTAAYLIPTLIGAAFAYTASGEASVVASQRLRQTPKLTQPVGLKAREIMQRRIVGAKSSATLQEFLTNITANGRHLIYPVFNGNEAIGTISLWEVAQVPGSRWGSITVGEVARSDLVQFDLDTDLREVVRMISQCHRMALIVDSDGHPAGLITPSDVVSALSIDEDAQTDPH